MCIAVTIGDKNVLLENHKSMWREYQLLFFTPYSQTVS